MNSSLKEGVLDSRQVKLGSNCNIEDQEKIAQVEVLKTIVVCKFSFVKIEYVKFGSRICTHICFVCFYVFKMFISRFMP